MATARSPADTRPYHHGGLPLALLAAAESVLVRDGIAGLGLRAIAREAGVSHTAPKHHFGDTTGLLSDLAAVGFQRLHDAMLAAMVGIADTQERRLAIARAYVHFAHANPALFGLMFRNEIIDMQRPSLAAAATATLQVMAPTIGGQQPAEGTEALALSGTEAVRVTAAWAYVHGLSTLLIDHRLQGILKSTTAFASPVDLVDAVLRQVRLGLDVLPDPAAPLPNGG
ncbi:TetR/AcrR family transcriptional regulator [Variovorax sp. J22P168]|uniref:TetR/AcrR family transcriptional regulator n=1 Tax=Variovorax jilinensis TaxID=3053513 RepID=UPI002577B066|nr:TetR/AcrR family transcriptional regulator [Variovorax sp. J22P168]MDM0014472.1 TetR/AcrR family transcriptional regulator [Variovorax sp. J22P168]